MKIIVRIIAVIMFLSITVSFIGYMMDWSLIKYAIPVNTSIFIILMASAIYNNRLENKKFKQFLFKAKQNNLFNNKHSRPHSQSPRLMPGEYSHYKSRKTGLNWTAGTVHGAVPKRRDKRTFLSRR